MSAHARSGGDSALALHWLLEGRQLPPVLLRRHLEPTARIDMGVALAEAGIPTAMIDVSDGLLADLMHILETSQVGARIVVDSLPLSTELRTAVRDDRSVLNCALTGGEDYELLFTAKPEMESAIDSLVTKYDLPVTLIGTLHENPGDIELMCAGKPYPMPSQRGYKHFSDGA